MPLGDLITQDEIRRFRAWGKVALPEEAAGISGGLYEISDRFKKK